MQDIHRANALGHRCTVTEDDYTRFAPRRALLERLSCLGSTVYTVYDMHSGHYLLRSDAFVKMLGLTPGEKISNEMEHFHRLIHPEDLPFVLETENEAFRFFRALSASEKKDYKLVYDFRVRHSGGVYLRFIHQFVVLELDSNGISWLVLIVTDLMEGRADDEQPRRLMIHMPTRRLYLFGNCSDNKADRLLTHRETEVLALIARGMESREIAEHLFISVHTVNNHRQHILSRTGTKNSSMAVAYARKAGII